MLLTSLDAITGTDRDVSGPGWKSRRLLLASDGMGYTMTDTVVHEGAALELEYKHHLEACYCIEGRGQITNLATGEVHDIKPFTLYALDQHDRHRLTALGGDMRLVCVFNPPLTGAEVHRADGSYAPVSC